MYCNAAGGLLVCAQINFALTHLALSHGHKCLDLLREAVPMPAGSHEVTAVLVVGRHIVDASARSAMRRARSRTLLVATSRVIFSCSALSSCCLNETIMPGGNATQRCTRAMSAGTIHRLLVVGTLCQFCISTHQLVSVWQRRAAIHQ